MAHYRETVGAARGKGAWDPWMFATYEVYRETASHMRVHQTAWWRDVLTVAADGAPPRVEKAIELLDAMSAMDGDRLWKAVLASLPPSPSTADVEKDDFPLPLPLRTIAGVVALELREAPADQRHAFANKWMADIGNGKDAEDFAYRVIRDFALRP
jgi:hypothetical protein